MKNKSSRKLLKNLIAQWNQSYRQLCCFGAFSFIFKSVLYFCWPYFSSNFVRPRLIIASMPLLFWNLFIQPVSDVQLLKRSAIVDAVMEAEEWKNERGLGPSQPSSCFVLLLLLCMDFTPVYQLNACKKVFFIILYLLLSLSQLDQSLKFDIWLSWLRRIIAFKLYYCSHNHVLQGFSLFVRGDRRFCIICFQQGLIVYQTPVLHYYLF